MQKYALDESLNWSWHAIETFPIVVHSSTNIFTPIETQWQMDVYDHSLYFCANAKVSFKIKNFGLKIEYFD